MEKMVHPLVCQTSYQAKKIDGKEMLSNFLYLIKRMYLPSFASVTVNAMSNQKNPSETSISIHILLLSELLYSRISSSPGNLSVPYKIGSMVSPSTGSPIPTVKVLFGRPMRKYGLSSVNLMVNGQSALIKRVYCKAGKPGKIKY